MRKYDAETGRFTCVEPLIDKYHKLSGYQYCFNNPVILKDWNGLDPGDMFNSADDAAKDFANFRGGYSILMNIEFATRIYKINGKYSYGEPEPGDEHYCYPSSVKIPQEATFIANAHTHGKYKNAPNVANHSFSSLDIDNDNNNKYNTSDYVLTTDGCLLYYDPKNPDGVRMVTCTGVPKDPFDPIVMKEGQWSKYGSEDYWNELWHQLKNGQIVDPFRQTDNKPQY